MPVIRVKREPPLLSLLKVVRVIVPMFFCQHPLMSVHLLYLHGCQALRSIIGYPLKMTDHIR
jgi:hypothetical protein